jgi:hypothetical protein
LIRDTVGRAGEAVAEGKVRLQANSRGWKISDEAVKVASEAVGHTDVT